MVVVWPPPSHATDVMPTIELAFRNHGILSEKIRERADIAPVPLALFSHNSYVGERMTDVKMIVTRLLENRLLLTQLSIREDKLSPKKRIRYGKPPAKPLGLVRQKAHLANNQMKLDMESLFVFSNLLLDQWAHVIAYLVNEREPEKFTFVSMTYQLQKKEDKGVLEPVWNNHHRDILWLFYQIRNYRNVFIEHMTSPWQRGTARDTYGDSFRLGTPSPVDWISQEEIEQEVNKIRPLAPLWARLPQMAWYTKHPRQMLEIIFFYIDEIEEQHHREKVWNVWKRLGGWTASYDTVAFRLMHFISESIPTMLDVMAKYPDKVHIGAASKN